jgi:hypothetical protein
LVDAPISATKKNPKSGWPDRGDDKNKGEDMRTIFAVFMLISCGAHEQAKNNGLPSTDRDALRAAYNERVGALAGKGWISDDCDAMIWSAKAGVALELLFDPRSAEIERGKFWRRPTDNPCWTPVAGDTGAKTTWSRDMAVCGLLPWSLLHRDLELVSSHIDYGESHDWVMGEPLEDGRVLYSPGLAGMFYKARAKLGGAEHGAAAIPQVWTPGLIDFEAHLQACAALILVEIDSELPDEAWGAVQASVSRETNSVFYAYLDGRRTGDQGRTMQMLLAAEPPIADYHRKPTDALADWIFTSFLLLR